jgi:hypothetical protein
LIFRQEARSTEDIYIDDDFCQGIQTLAANMELLPTPDLFDSFDFNLWTAEILHREERDCDWTLTHDDQMPLEWRENGKQEEIEGKEKETAETETADDAKNADEPKAEEK